MKIYTKTGDKGTTSLLSGARVNKFDIRIEAYGTVDELNSFIGLLRSQELKPEDISFLIVIQNQLFNLGSILAMDAEKSKIKMPEITEENIQSLEQKMDQIESCLPPLKDFILPGGNDAVSYCHICRSICRRAERLIVKLNNESMIDEKIIRFINRLSDYLFMLSRKISHDFNIPEIKWNTAIK